MDVRNAGNPHESVASIGCATRRRKNFSRGYFSHDLGGEPIEIGDMVIVNFGRRP
jgi:hypothetical protein